MTPEVCSDYIAHIQKMMVKVIEVNGEPSGHLVKILIVINNSIITF